MKYEKIFDTFSNGVTRKLKKGDILYNEGSMPEGVFLIKTGLIGLFHVAPNGKETFLRVFGEGNTIGHRSYFASEVYHASSIALAPTTVEYLSQDKFEEFIKENPEFIRDVLTQVSQDLGLAELRMSGLHDKTAASRIVESILFLKLKYPQQLWTRKNIADFSGSTFETVTRVLNKLEKSNEITKNGRDFTINDPERLLSIIEEI